MSSKSELLGVIKKVNRTILRVEIAHLIFLDSMPGRDGHISELDALGFGAVDHAATTTIYIFNADIKINFNKIHKRIGQFL